MAQDRAEEREGQEPSCWRFFLPLPGRATILHTSAQLSPPPPCPRGLARKTNPFWPSSPLGLTCITSGTLIPFALIAVIILTEPDPPMATFSEAASWPSQTVRPRLWMTDPARPASFHHHFITVLVTDACVLMSVSPPG